jgi:hypothetical protein
VHQSLLDVARSSHTPVMAYVPYLREGMHSQDQVPQHGYYTAADVQLLHRDNSVLREMDS